MVAPDDDFDDAELVGSPALAVVGPGMLLRDWALQLATVAAEPRPTAQRARPSRR